MSPELSDAAIPLFPLGTVLFPEGMLPLRIFEVRYLTLVKNCHRTGTPFGVVSLTEGQEVQRVGGSAAERFNAVGTLAHIVDFRMPQPGLIEIVVRGGSRFRVTASTQLPHGLWMADIKCIPADPPVKVPSDLAYVGANLLRMLDVFASADVSPVVEPKHFDDAGWIANRWCELLPLQPDNRQRLMEMEDPLLRLELIGDMLDQTEFGRN